MTGDGPGTAGPDPGAEATTEAPARAAATPDGTTGGARGNGRARAGRRTGLAGRRGVARPLPATTPTGSAGSAHLPSVLVVAPYPPERDGIGAYAVQQVRALRRAGHPVEVCSPRPSAAHHHGDLRGPAGARLLARLGSRFDRVVVHFHPNVLYRLPPTGGARLATGLGYGLALRRLGNVELRVHEIDHRWASRDDRAAPATRFLLRGARRVTVHSEALRRLLVDDFGVRADRVEVVGHGADFTPRTTADRARARATLGLPADEHVFLCIGFVQPHKGFDRAARAFAGLGRHGARLAIVGSARVDDQATADHVAELRAIAAREPGIDLRLGYVSDEMFDRWIVAADTVVLPYRHIWSSSVLERAALLGRPVIATGVGDLPERIATLPAGSAVVDDNVALARALAAAAGVTDGQHTAVPWPVTAAAAGAGAVDRERLQAEIRARAAAARGGVAGPGADPAGGDGPARSAPVRRLRPLRPPPPVSARPGVSLVKRLIHRLLAWELTPIADQVNSLQRATADALDANPRDTGPRAPAAGTTTSTRDTRPDDPPGPGPGPSARHTRTDDPATGPGPGAGGRGGRPRRTRPSGPGS